MRLLHTLAAALAATLLAAGCATWPMPDELAPTDAPVATEPDTAPRRPAAARPVPSWDECTLASCWAGKNASERMMNVLSPKMSDAVFRTRLATMLSNGANTAHVILVNLADGECAGYSPWGANVGPRAGPCDAETVAHMKARIEALRAAGLAVVVWVQTDDSASWAKDLAKNADACMAAIANAGLFDEASTVVAGLEMDEYWTLAETSAVVGAIRKVYPGKVGVHHTSGKTLFAPLADVLFYQTEPGRTAEQIVDETKLALRTKKPVNFFELARGPDLTRAQAALDAGAFGVGNCAPGNKVP